MNRALIETVLNCNNEKISLQMSGLENPFEHPNFCLLWDRMVLLASKVEKQKTENDYDDELGSNIC
mgnify:CR=1 FL=1